MKRNKEKERECKKIDGYIFTIKFCIAINLLKGIYSKLNPKIT